MNEHKYTFEKKINVTYTISAHFCLWQFIFAKQW